MSIKTPLLTTLLVLSLAAAAQHTDLSSYYAAAKGKKGEDLKTALCGIISTGVSYHTYGDLWDDFKNTDARSDGKVWDMYSGTSNFTFGTDKAGSYSKEGDVYNREHSFPQSWMGTNASNSSKGCESDLFHLYPTDGYVNGRRGNNPFGETSKPTYSSDNGFSKLGPCSYSGYTGTVFEPNDIYKGDFARTYFYMVTMYENKIASWYTNNANSRTTLDGTTYPAFQTWQLNMLLKWATNDAVSEKETNRNNAVDKIQGNRNPFIDFPGLEQYIWGSKTDVAFDPANYDGSSTGNTDDGNEDNNDTDTGNTDGKLLWESFSGYTSASDDSNELKTDNKNLDYSGWTTFTKVFLGKNGCGKLGNSSNSGSMTASGIKLSGDATLTFKVLQFGSDTGTLTVSVDGATATGALSVTPTADWTEHTVSITNASGNVSITFATSAKRAYIDDIALTPVAAETETQEPTGRSAFTEMGVFERVTSTKQLVSGKRYIVAYANGAESKAMGKVSSNQSAAVNVSVENNEVDINNLATKPLIFTLGTSTVSGTSYWTFSNGYYLGGPSSANLELSASSLEDKNRWTITISDGFATIASKAATSRQLLYRGSTYKVFKNYSSSNVGDSDYGKVSLFVEKELSVATFPDGLYNLTSSKGTLRIGADGTPYAGTGSESLEAVVTATANADDTYTLSAQGVTLASAARFVEVADGYALRTASNTYLQADGTTGSSNVAFALSSATAVSWPMNSLGGKSYATLYTAFPYQLADGVTAYTVTVSGDYALTEAVSDNFVPAATPVLLVANTPIASATIEPYASGLGSAAPAANQLRGVCLSTPAPSGAYVFSAVDGEVGFYAFAGTTLSPNKAFLEAASGVRGFVLGGAVTGIDGLRAASHRQPAYDLQGRRVDSLSRGLYIQGGRKLLVR